jgi:uncharacterized DUF497 family protein
VKIVDFDWHPDIVWKLQSKHNVEYTEVGEVFVTSPLIRFVGRGKRPGEDVYSARGQTLAGRYLIVFFIYKQNRHAFVLSARDMTPAERKGYDHR